MKEATEMNLPELRKAFDDSIRHQPGGTHTRIENDPHTNEGDPPLLIHSKNLYRRIKELEILEEKGLEKIEVGGCAPPVYVR